jgi:hypothetical protein
MQHRYSSSRLSTEIEINFHQHDAALAVHIARWLRDEEANAKRGERAVRKTGPVFVSA